MYRGTLRYFGRTLEVNCGSVSVNMGTYRDKYVDPHNKGNVGYLINEVEPVTYGSFRLHGLPRVRSEQRGEQLLVVDQSDIAREIKEGWLVAFQDWSVLDITDTGTKWVENYREADTKEKRYRELKRKFDNTSFSDYVEYQELCKQFDS